MARGGKREGAGRKKGGQNAKTKERLEAVCKDGLTPLEYMLQVLRDAANDEAVRMDAAKAAAPYIHPKLSSVEHKGDESAPLLPERIEIVLVNAKG